MSKKIKKRLKKRGGRRVARARRNCYELSFNLAVEIGRDRNVEVFLVHGLPELRDPETLALTGKRYGHAWVEFNDLVFDPVAQAMVDKEGYYREGKIDEAEVVRYTPNEARELVLTSKHFGPWDDRFQADDIIYANKGAGK